MTARAIGVAVATMVLAAVALLGLWIAHDWYTERYVVERRDDGAAVTRVVQAMFSRTSALKVGGLTGTVQSSASDTRGFGMLTSDKVMKAPFSVEYFVDVSRISAGDYHWDQDRRTLTLDVPDVTVGAANVDEAARTLSRTRGLFVTRDASDALARRVSQQAQAAAATEAHRPERIAAARDNARRALKSLVAGPLAATGLTDVRVAVTFPYERSGPRERWDTSRSVKDVLDNTR